MFDYAHMEHEERPFAQRLAEWIEILAPQSVIDIGAGSGVYVEELRRRGIAARGYDIADPQPRPDLVLTCDMLTLMDPHDLVLCLEVAEHIDQSLSSAVVASIWNNCRPGGWVIWSAAQPGQGGVGHVNCQPTQYWRELARNQGFLLRPDVEWRMHEWITLGYHMGWFARNRQIWQRPYK